MARSSALCQKIAANVARIDRFADVTRIRVMSGTHESLDFLMYDKLGVEYERAKCEVKR